MSNSVLEEITQGESQTVEFKKLWKDEYLKTICAFANSEGGKLFIGISDNKGVAGVENVTSLLEILPNKINNRLALLVDVLSHDIEGKQVMEIKVHKTFAPVSFNGKFFKRSGSNTIELNSGNLTNFLLKKILSTKYIKIW